MKHHIVWATIAAVWAGALGQALAEPLNTMDEVGAALLNCWSAPPGSQGSSVTLAFSFKRDGTLMGKPRPTAISVNGDEKMRKAFVDAAVAAAQRCTPLSFSPTIASGIAGNVFTLQFASPAI
ncbi:hypothetical protein [Aminobacter sp. AP02]|uniref:hypothetical protein n=1 Tax=Aminobacter sp. AP02 TaxID=2135737 RepID=UPI000D6C0FBF|nr:hypothetical protein [Aminobacter sp. AP02]PWK70718.1 hypothetical protein C8K44_107197 [Aminobacter sp. AP02]